MRKPRVFLSHSDKDRRFVGRLARTLDRHGIEVWYSRSRLRGAAQWHDEIGNALRRSDWFVVVLSPASVRSVWVKRELTYVLGKPRYEKHVIPLVLRDCHHEKLSWALGGFQQVDFRREFDRGCQALLAVWSIGYVPERGVRARRDG